MMRKREVQEIFISKLKQFCQKVNNIPLLDIPHFLTKTKTKDYFCLPPKRTDHTFYLSGLY
jgi:hypothetical protein